MKPQTRDTFRPNNFDLVWILNLFGTAVGAGVLFLPINAGMQGFWPILVMAVIIGPMTFLSHRALARFVLSSSHPGSNITEVVEEHFGKTAGKLITLLYFFAIFPILLIYGNGITNTVASFLENQMHTSMPRPILSFILIAGLIGIFLCGERIVLKVTEWLVYPLVLILLALSLYLIPHWNAASLATVPDAGQFLNTLWITIPVLIFSFNHSPAISSFALSQAQHYGDAATTDEHVSKTLLGTTATLLIFVMLFVFSCVLTLTPAELAEAKAQNISILSYLANKFDNPWISYVAPFVAFLAIASSFFGHYMGAREGLEGLYLKMRDQRTPSPELRKNINRYCALFFLVTLWLVAIANPGILGLIEALGGPVIAMILFIMPIYAIYKIPSLSAYRKDRIANLFILIMGGIAITNIVYSLIF